MLNFLPLLAWNICCALKSNPGWCFNILTGACLLVCLAIISIDRRGRIDCARRREDETEGRKKRMVGTIPRDEGKKTDDSSLSPFFLSLTMRKFWWKTTTSRWREWKKRNEAEWDGVTPIEMMIDKEEELLWEREKDKNGKIDGWREEQNHHPNIQGIWIHYYRSPVLSTTDDATPNHWYSIPDYRTLLTSEHFIPVLDGVRTSRVLVQVTALQLILYLF